MLGVGENIAFIYDRGGAQRIARLGPITRVKWTRERDAISEAEVTVVEPSGSCCDAISNIYVGRHELVIFRDGIRVWEGPITLVTNTRTTVTIRANDICHYLSRTIMRKAYDNRYAKKNSKVALVTTRMTNILLTELVRKESLDPPVNILPYLTVRPSAKGAKTSRYTKPYQKNVWEEMDSLAWRAGLDYVAIGRRLILNDVHEPLGKTAALSQNDFLDELVVSQYGMELATRSAVTDGDGHWAAVGGVDDFYGEVELLHSLYDVSVRPADPAKPTKKELAALAKSMTSQAQRNLSGRYPTPVVVRIPDNSSLDPNTALTIDDLVPGVRIPLRVDMACLKLEQEQKLDKVTVVQDKDKETISITLSPSPGETPWDDTGESSGDDIGEAPTT